MVTERIHGYCALCWSSCGCISTVVDGKLEKVEADPNHPTGAALCGKGLAAPDYVYSEARVLYPMKRTRPKDQNDPGWERISWDEALDSTAEAINKIRTECGPESIAFSLTTSAGTAMQDASSFVERLRHAIGTPNNVVSMELCAFSKEFVYPYTFGVPMPPSDVQNSDCIILWGHNPNSTWLAFATRISKAIRRGAKAIVIDPVRVGFAAKAEQWLRIRPGSDGALALSIAHVIIKEQLFDKNFVTNWTNAPFLVREDNGAMLTEQDLKEDGNANYRVAWNLKESSPIFFDISTGKYLTNTKNNKLALEGIFQFEGACGSINCKPVFQLYTDLCKEHAPTKVAPITWLEESQIVDTARLIGSSRAVSCYAWAGLEMHSNTSQTGRAIACLYALTGCIDAPGGNVILDTVPVQSIVGAELKPNEGKAPLGREERSLGPESIFGWITTDALYKSILKREPYGVDALVSFGLNMLVSHADGKRGREALRKLQFMVHADLFMTPTAKYADIFLPVNSPWEREALCTDFKVDQKAVGHMQFRQKVIEPLGESRSDAWITFELAKRLGFSEKFWNGNIEEAYREILKPSGIDLDTLKNSPQGINANLETTHKKYTDTGGFPTPSKRVEIFSETLQKHGYPSLPVYIEPAMGPFSRPELFKDFPLVLTDTKSPHFIHSQFRHVARLRRHEREPRAQVHPDTAAERGLNAGDWISIKTPHGNARAVVGLSQNLHPGVVRATVGWWQDCKELSLPGYNIETEESANYNAIIGNEDADPIGGCVPHKSYLCEIEKLQVEIE